MVKVPNESEFEKVWSEHGPMACRIAKAHERDPDLRKDLEQDIALALWHALPKFEGRSSLKTFVARIAENCSFNHAARHMKANNTQLLDESVEDFSTPPQAQIEKKDAYNKLLEAVQRLPRGQRDVIVLYLEGFSYEDISHILGLTSSNIGVLINRAKSRLKILMGE